MSENTVPHSILQEYSVTRTTLVPPGTRILAFDLGTKTGVTYMTPNTVVSQCVELASDKQLRKYRKEGGDTERFDIRFQTLVEYVSQLLDGIPDDSHIILGWEQIQFATYRLQLQLWTSLRASLWTSTMSSGKQVTLMPVTVGAIKKFAGKGNFDKSEMRLAAIQKGLIPASVTDDNLIDSLWLAEYIASTLKL